MEGWKRLSFRANDCFIDRARQFCENKVAEDFQDEYNCCPMEVFYQSNDGKNYKVLLLGQHFQTKEFKCFSSITFVPDGKRPQPELKKETFKSLDGTACTLSADREAKLKGCIKHFFKGEKDFTPVKYFENAIEGGNVYVLKVDQQYVGVYELGDDIQVDCVLN